jgi:DNA-binding SARP family transcriptional activator
MDRSTGNGQRRYTALGGARSGSAPPQLSLLGGFSISCNGSTASLSQTSQRLLIFLALRGRKCPVKRVLAAGTLWPDALEDRAQANLRSVLHRLEAVGRRAVAAGLVELSLDSGVRVDLWEAEGLAARLLDRSAELRETDLAPSTVDILGAELLPGWYEDWVLAAVETWHQIRLHALEKLSHHLTVRGRFGDAMVAALAAVRIDPLRESAHAAVIQTHLAEGNQSEALREYHRYRELMLSELGLEPTVGLRRLLDGLVSPVDRSQQSGTAAESRRERLRWDSGTDVVIAASFPRA